MLFAAKIKQSDGNIYFFDKLLPAHALTLRTARKRSEKLPIYLSCKKKKTRRDRYDFITEMKQEEVFLFITSMIRGTFLS